MTQWTRFLVVNPIGPLAGFGDVLRVVGAKPREFERAIVPRGRVLEVPEAIASGVVGLRSAAVDALAKLRRNKCLVPYDPEVHVDAILESPPEERPTFPAWLTAENEKGRAIEAEMRAEEEQARRETMKQG